MRYRNEFAVLVTPHICPVCGRTYCMSITEEDWGYTARDIHGHKKALCSYTCLRKFEKPRLDAEKARIMDELERAWYEEMRAEGNG